VIANQSAPLPDEGPTDWGGRFNAPPEPVVKVTRLTVCGRWSVALVASVVVAVCPIFATASPPSTAVEGRAADANQAAWEAFHQRDFPRCEQLAREAWQLAEVDRDLLQAAVAAANLAAAVAMRGRLDEALEWSRRAEERLGPDPQPLVRGRILVAQAILQKVRGEDEASEQAFRRAREALGPEDWPLAVADALVQGYDWNDMDAAYRRLSALRDMARGSGDPQHAALVLLDLGWLEGVGGGLGAVRFLEEARAIFATSGQPAVLPLVDHNLGAVFLGADRLGEAQTAFERGLAAARAVDRTDGLSLAFADWRFNLRMSNTEPVLRLNVETRADPELLRQRTDELLALIDGPA